MIQRRACQPKQACAEVAELVNTLLKRVLPFTFLLQSNEGESHRSSELIAPAFKGVVYTAELTFSELFRDTYGMEM